MAEGAIAGGPSAAGRMLTRGHDRAVAAVRAMIAGRTPHALLIGGPAGIGKTTLADDLAAGLLCDDPEPAARPCRACRGCRLVERGRHPDLHRLAPAGAGDQIRIGKRDGAEDGTVRRLVSDLVLLPVEGGARVVIVERADRLTDDAQAALLKTLEEPAAGVTIILCADDEDRLLPTVRSRCARIRLGPVATREIEAILDDGDVADPPVAARLARIAGGRPGAARLLARAPAAVALRDEIARSLLDLLTAGPAARLAAARELPALAATLAKALDRAAAEDADPARDSTSSGGRRRTGRERSKGSAAGEPPEASAIAPDASAVAVAAGGDGNGLDEPDGSEEDGGSRVAAPAAERRRSASLLVGLWRDVARDLLVARLGAERQVRDPGLLDDLRAAAASLSAVANDPAGPVAPAGGDPVVASLAAFLGRLDAAGELLEANVRPEIVIDTLLLAWPRGRNS